MLAVVCASVLTFGAASPASPGAVTASGGAGVGLERAYAHNDYLHVRPLLDAVQAGFQGVEADVWLVHGKLLVGHDAQSLTAGRSLESLYLKPLRRIVAANGGAVYRGDRDYFTLVIEIKSAAGPTYLELNRELRRYRAVGSRRLLTTFGPHGIRDGAVTAIVSGNRPRALMARQRLRYAFYDGRLSDLGTTNQTLVPLISDAWILNFSWNGVGPMPPEQRKLLRSIVRTAHAHGQRVRFYFTFDGPPAGGIDARAAVWKELLAAHVDFINTDHLAELRAFLLRHDHRLATPFVTWAHAHR